MVFGFVGLQLEVNFRFTINVLDSNEVDEFQRQTIKYKNIKEICHILYVLNWSLMNTICIPLKNIWHFQRILGLEVEIFVCKKLVIQVVHVLVSINQ